MTLPPAKLRLFSGLLIAVFIPCCGPGNNPPVAASPTSLVATASTTARIDLVWVDASTNEFEFRIERAEAAAGPFVQVGVVPANSQAYSDRGLLPGKNYFYRVTAWNGAGESAFAGPADATTNALTWTAGPMSGGPSLGLSSHSAVYDSLGRRMVVFGGLDDALTVYNHIWFFDLNTLAIAAAPWSSPAVTGTAPFRLGHSAIYDTANHRMIVFGGQDDVFVYRNEVFALDLTTLTWSQPAVTGAAPTARAYHTAVYDSANQQMIVYGGHDGTFELPDLHVLSLPAGAPFAWSTPPVGTAPVQRSRHSSVYDPLQRRMVAFAGLDQESLSDGSVLSSETWSLSTNGGLSWNPLLFFGTPGFRMGQSAVYDAANQRMVVFGGTVDTTPTVTNALWGMRLDVSPVWSILSPGSAPDGRTDHSAIYDPAFHRMILYGGVDALAASFNQVWILRL